MNVYYTTSPIQSSELLRAAFEREGIPFGGRPLLRTANGKPYFSPPAPRFNLTHTKDLCAVAVGKAEVGLDAEKRQPRKLEALSSRLTDAEKKEDFFRLWTAKEAYIKFRGGTIGADLKPLVFSRGVLYRNGEPLNVFLYHTELENCCVCLCMAEEEKIEFIKLN